jgi:hypothetical protein
MILICLAQPDPIHYVNSEAQSTLLDLWLQFINGLACILCCVCRGASVLWAMDLSGFA